MAIKKIRLENFTVFEKIVIDCCAGINVFIGENGTGKTHLLKAIYAFCEGGIFYHDGPDSDIAPHPMFLNTFQIEDYTALLRRLPDGSVANNPLVIAVETDEGEDVHQINPFDLPFPVWEVSEGSASTPKSSVFIPAKDMLTHAGIEKDYMHRNLPFDGTLIDILNKTGVSTLRKLPDYMSKVLERISDIIGGKVLYKNDRYYIEKPTGILTPFTVEAEGFKKLGLIYRLIETGCLAKDGILIWDEPDANLNPKLIPLIVDIMLELKQAGIQIFLATHDYNLMKYFSVKSKNDGGVAFYSFYNTENGVVCERDNDYDLLETNAIIDANTKLLEDEIEGVQ